MRLSHYNSCKWQIWLLQEFGILVEHRRCNQFFRRLELGLSCGFVVDLLVTPSLFQYVVYFTYLLLCFVVSWLYLRYFLFNSALSLRMIEYLALKTHMYICSTYLVNRSMFSKHIYRPLVSNILQMYQSMFSKLP